MAIGKKAKRVIEAEGIAHVSATFNNTTITITDSHGNTISWGSSGKAGFKGSKKSTPFAATVAGEQAGREAVTLGVRRVHVRVQGPGSGRESAIQALVAAGAKPPAAAFRYLTKLRRVDGSIRYSAQYATTPLWVSAQALPALVRRSFPLK
jgi:Ribosomal protein S11